MGPPPGWYPDPWRAAPWRWWDGTQWSAYWSSGAAPTAPAVTPHELGRAYLKEQRTWRRARFALVAVFMILAGQWIGAIWMSRAWHHLWTAAVSNANNGGSQQVQLGGFSPTIGLWLDLLYLASAAVWVVFLIWQHAAATVARGLGYPARTSPAFGVGSWFIPVINLWFPYWALSDLLPPDHPMRGRCLWAWLAYLGAGLTSAATFFIALASTAAAIVPMVISGLLAVAAVALGAQLMRAVNDDHRSRIALSHSPVKRPS